MIGATFIGQSQPDGKSSNVGIMRISAELLRQALCLPEGTKFCAFRDSQIAGGSGVDLECRIESPGLKAIPHGSMIPHVSASLWSTAVTAEDGGGRYDIPYFKEWIQP